MYSPNRQHTQEVAAHEELCDKIHEAAEAGETTFNYSHNYSLKRFPTDIKILKPTLQILHIDNCFELDTIPPSIGDLSNLRWLNISYNKVRELPGEISKLRHLERLHVNNNQLESLPIEIWALKELRELRCDCNNIKALPTGVLFLRNMEQLFMNNNPLIQESDAEGAEVCELIPSLRYGDCGNCNTRFTKSIAMISFHKFCGVTDVPFCHYVVSKHCEEQLRHRLQTHESSPCSMIVSGSGDTYVLGSTQPSNSSPKKIEEKQQEQQQAAPEQQEGAEEEQQEGEENNATVEQPAADQ